MRRSALLGLFGLLAVLAPATAAQGQTPEGETYVVLYREHTGAGRQAVRSAGGTVVKENPAIGLATVTATRPDFLAAAAARQPAHEGAGRNRPIGFIPPGFRPKHDERLVEEGRSSTGRPWVEPASRCPGSPWLLCSGT